MRQSLKFVVGFYLIALLLIGLNEAHILQLPRPFDRVLTEIGVALMAVGLIHFLDHRTLIPTTAKSIGETLGNEVRAIAGEIIEGISNKTDQALSAATRRTVEALDRAEDRLLASSEEASTILQRQVESINAMEYSNLASIYQGRPSAAERVRSAIADSSVVRLMGVSLNDFLRTGDSLFQQAWEMIVDGAGAGTKRAEILLIDPYCNGAVLRSFAERRNAQADAGRLEIDVLFAARRLQDLRKELGANACNLQVKLYSLAATTFLCQLETRTFAEYYYFWSERVLRSPMPLFEYRKKEQGHSGPCMHSVLGQHFRFVWQYASVELHDFLPIPSRGPEYGAHVSGMSAIYIERDRPNFRMRKEIDNSKRIYVQGITLKSFFGDPHISRALKKRAEEADECEIRILLLDPDSNAAKQRAYREFKLNVEHDVSFSEFVRDHYRDSILFRDWQDIVTEIRRMMKVTARVILKKYATAPTMFLLLGDSRAFVEQYSYGKLSSDPSNMEEDLILGSDMPLLEYEKSVGPVYAAVIEELLTKGDLESRTLPRPYFFSGTTLSIFGAWLTTSKARNSPTAPRRVSATSIATATNAKCASAFQIPHRYGFIVVSRKHQCH